VLAIEPDTRQAAIVKRVVKEHVQAEVVVVDSRDAAFDAIRTAIPDVVLVSMLLSPRDEDELIQHLRTLEGAAHLQTHTIPQLASALGPDDEDGGGGLFSAFRRKKQAKQAASAPAGCDPEMFADEIRLYLQRAEEKKRAAAESGTISPMPGLARRQADAPAAAVEDTSESIAGSSWASPFEWRPTADRRIAPLPSIEEPIKAEPLMPDSHSAIEDLPSPIPEVASIDDLPSPIPDVASIEDLPSPVLEVASIEDLPSSIPEVASIEDLPSSIPLVASLDLDSAMQDLESLSFDPSAPPPAPAPPPVHTPAPFSVWARKEIPRTEVVPEHGELVTLFARLGVPDDVASVTYPEGVRIRRVRVRAARDAQSPLQGAMLLGKRKLAELTGSDARA
jgi:CheY-like chemotaxis protein